MLWRKNLVSVVWTAHQLSGGKHLILSENCVGTNVLIADSRRVNPGGAYQRRTGWCHERGRLWAEQPNSYISWPRRWSWVTWNWGWHSGRCHMCKSVSLSLTLFVICLVQISSTQGDGYDFHYTLPSQSQHLEETLRSRSQLLASQYQYHKYHGQGKTIT